MYSSTAALSSNHERLTVRNMGSTSWVERKDEQMIESVALAHPARRGFLPETTCCGNLTFPFKLHEMLIDAEKKKFDHIVSWQGLQAFKVHDRTIIEKRVLPASYYSQTRYKSFQRQRKSVLHESHTRVGSVQHHLTLHSCCVRLHCPYVIL